MQGDDGISKCLQDFGPNPSSDGLELNAFINVSYIRVIFTSQLGHDDNNLLKGVGPNQTSFDKQTFFGLSTLLSTKKTNQGYIRTQK